MAVLWLRETLQVIFMAVGRPLWTIRFRCFKNKKGASADPVCPAGPPMGSFLTRTLLYRYPDSGIRAAVICGTGWQPAPVLRAGLAMCRLACQKEGETHTSDSLRELIFGSYNKRVEDPQTPFDWICSDRSVIDAYVADPLCGFSETAGLDRDMLQGIQMNQNRKTWRVWTKNCRFFL